MALEPDDMLIGEIVTLFFDAGKCLAVPFLPVNHFAPTQRDVSEVGASAFNRRTVARYWMIRATAVGSRHMTLCFSFIENGEGGSHHGNDQEERF